MPGILCRSLNFKLRSRSSWRESRDFFYRWSKRCGSYTGHASYQEVLKSLKLRHTNKPKLDAILETEIRVFRKCPNKRITHFKLNPINEKQRSAWNRESGCDWHCQTMTIWRSKRFSLMPFAIFFWWLQCHYNMLFKLNSSIVLSERIIVFLKLEAFSNWSSGYWSSRKKKLPGKL